MLFIILVLIIFHIGIGELCHSLLVADSRSLCLIVIQFLNLLRSQFMYFQNYIKGLWSKSLCLVFENVDAFYKWVNHSPVFLKAGIGLTVLTLLFGLQLGIIYLNLQPQTVMTDKRGHVVLTDFGASVTFSSKEKLEARFKCIISEVRELFKKPNHLPTSCYLEENNLKRRLGVQIHSFLYPIC